jgi:hypothetical protein
MFISAGELSGLRPVNLIQNETYKIFAQIIKSHPNITLDNTILTFEKASPNLTLEEFAKSKQRTAKSYRNVYKQYFAK